MQAASEPKTAIALEPRTRTLKGRLVWSVLGLLAAGIAMLLSQEVDKRVTYIDLGTIYGNLRDYYDAGRTVFLLRSGGYPSIGDGGDFHYSITNGLITLGCSLNDVGPVPNLRVYRKASSSRVIGDESFFENYTTTEERFELAYRRYNVNACFRISPIHGFREGRFSCSDTDKAEMEMAAALLDNAILCAGPNVKVEEVRLYQVVGYKIRVFAGGISYLIGRLFHPGGHW